MKLWEAAAGNGHSAARFALGTMAWRGEGSSPNDSEALKWWQLAAGTRSTTNRRNVFICYARSDGSFVLPLAEALRGRDVPVWIDQWDIPASADWDKTIDEALYSCTEFLIVLSPASVDSNEVRAELRVALSEKKPIIPVLFRQCRIPRQLMLTQHIDYTNRQPDDQPGLAEIVSALSVTQRTREHR
jgi:hypothetical protein